MTKQRTRTWRQLLGFHFEDEAMRFLKTKSLVLVERNYRCRLGESDLIMLDGNMLVFVEVRYRYSANHGSAIATVDLRKQAKIRLAARHFLYSHKQFQACNCRFDVLGIEAAANSGKNFCWIQSAFC